MHKFDVCNRRCLKTNGQSLQDHLLTLLLVVDFFIINCTCVTTILSNYRKTKLICSTQLMLNYSRLVYSKRYRKCRNIEKKKQ